MRSIIALALLLIATAAQAVVVPYAIQVSQVDAAGVSITSQYLSPATAPFVIYQPATTGFVAPLTFGSNLSITGGVLNAVVPTPPARVFSAATRTLNTSFQVNALRDSQVSYTVNVTLASTVLTTVTGTIVLKYADDSGITTNVVTVATGQSSLGGVLASGTSPQTLTGWIPAGKYVIIQSTNNSGTPTYSAPTGQEVLE